MADSPKGGAPDCLAPLEHVHTLGRTDGRDLKAKKVVFIGSCLSSITSSLFIVLLCSLSLPSSLPPLSLPLSLH